MSTTTVNVAFQSNLLRDIDRAARAEARSRSDFLREAARAHIRRKQRWAGVFALGRKIAIAKSLTPVDIAMEIAAYRNGRAHRP